MYVMDIKRLKIVFFIAALSLFGVSVVAQNAPMNFDSRIVEGRAAPKTTFAAGDAFGVYAQKSAAAWAQTLPFNSSMFMYNVPVTKQASGSWTYSPVKYWETGMKMSYFAYYPYNSAVTVTGSNGGTAGAPVITYNNPTTAASQRDVMYAPLKDQNRDGISNPTPVAIPFKHSMAQIKFSIKLSIVGLLNIKSVVINNAVSKGSLNLETGVWTLSTDTDDKKTFTPGIITDFTSLNLLGYTSITPSGGELMMIPQNLAGVSVVITYRTLLGLTDLYITKNLTGSWVANTVYNYQIII